MEKNLNKDLEWIKKHYSENMLKLCRKYFSTLLDTKGLLPFLLTDSFYYSKYLAEDIISDKKEIEFKDYILSKAQINTNDSEVYETPEKLLSKVGYDLYKCETEEQILQFKKYYSVGDELCTFDGGRLNRCFVFFALKKDCENIARKDKPTREDEYGISVISIQFNKGRVNDVSIKSRYNHSVSNSDATFKNNLENIIDGLTKSFEYEYGYNITNSYNNPYFKLNNYIMGPNCKHYKQIQQIENTNYCVENIVIKDNEIINYDKGKFILIENYLLDLKKMEIIDLSGVDNSFPACFNQISKIEKTKTSIGSEIKIYDVSGIEASVILMNKDNEIIEAYLPNAEKIGNNFLYNCRKIKKVCIPNVCEIGDNFLLTIENIDEIILENVKILGKKFIYKNKNAAKIYIPNIIEMGDDCFYNNKNIREIEYEYLMKIGNNIFHNNESIITMNMPNVIEIGDECFYYNKSLLEVYLPSVTKVGNKFLYFSRNIEKIEMPQVKKVGNNVLYYNEKAGIIYMPNLKESGYGFLEKNLSNSDKNFESSLKER